MLLDMLYILSEPYTKKSTGKKGPLFVSNVAMHEAPLTERSLPRPKREFNVERT